MLRLRLITQLENDREIRETKEIEADLVSGERQRDQRDQEKGKETCNPS